MSANYCEEEEYAQLHPRYLKNDYYGEDCTPPTEEAPKVSKKYVQYMESNGDYIPCGRTVDRLVPGLYGVKAAPDKGVYISYHKNTTDDLIITPNSKTEKIVNEIAKFWTRKDVFKKFGLTHKRGILLHGVPGSGKTSITSLVIKQIAAMGGVALLGDAHPINVTEVLHFMREISPDMPILLILEDIDSIIKMHGESNVLSLLDGENSIANLITIATTNYPEDLAGRITNRPSRFDLVIEVGLPTFEDRLAYIKSRNLDLSDDEILEWADATEGLGIAHIKELIVGVLALDNDFDEVLKRLRDMAKAPTSEPSKKVGFGK